MTKVNYGWLKTYGNEYFAPKTTLSQIYNDTGSRLADAETIGSATQPIYLNGGTLTASAASIGSETQLMYLNDGTLTASAASVGDSSSPVYLNNGVLTACGSLGVTISAVTSSSSNSYYVLGQSSSGKLTNLYFNTGVYFKSGVLYGAAWNDYAEYRRQEEEIKPGYCVKSTDDGILSYTTERLQSCEGIVSDTFGFAIGETDKCKTPIAVAGRVLAYTDEDRNSFHFGDAVCASKDGKVSKMTKEEITEYPDKIIGIVSEIPTYETWGEGNVKVDNRIWIKVR